MIAALERVATMFAERARASERGCATGAIEPMTHADEHLRWMLATGGGASEAPFCRVGRVAHSRAMRASIARE